MLDSTVARDASQVVSRWFPGRDPNCPHNILMVDQLWLWTICGSQLPVSGTGMNRQHIHEGTLSAENRPREDTTTKPQQHYVISSFPSRHESRSQYGQTNDDRPTYDDLRGLVLDPIGRKREPINWIGDLVSRILEACCSIFDKSQDVETLQFIQMFANAIGTTVS